MADATTAKDVECQDPATQKPQECETKEMADANPSKSKLEEDRTLSWPVVIACVFGALTFLYIFLVGINVMASSVTVLGGRGAGAMYGMVDNPITGLMAGVLSTVLVQSSSTTTSIVVTMCGADVIDVRRGIPIIMGANIGTSVTNTLVALGWSGNRIDLERAFSGATVHDMFNGLTVITLLPIEAIVAAIQGEGGPLYWLTYVLTEALMGGGKGDVNFKSPVKAITKPVGGIIVKANKNVIYAMALGRPEARKPISVNSTLCASSPVRRLAEDGATSSAVDGERRSLLSRRLAEDCGKYFCLDKDHDKYFKKVSSKAYKTLKKCKGYVLDEGGEPCGKDKCYLNAGGYYDKNVDDGRLIKGGFVRGAGDTGGGIIGLILSLMLLILGMAGMTKTLYFLMCKKLNKVVHYSLKLNEYLAVLIGCLITMFVQSSSAVTSSLTPLCAMGVLPLTKMLPLTVGSNIGTTFTALMAALVIYKDVSIQAALCHLFFNVLGFLIWFPIPFMRRFPLAGARILGLYSSYYKSAPKIYIGVWFVIVPCIFLLVSFVMTASMVGGIIMLAFVFICLGIFCFFWCVGYPMDGEHAWCYKLLSKEQRKVSAWELAACNAEVREEMKEVDKDADGKSSSTANATGDAEKPSVPETCI
jgi:sodium-dependent phosphate cotransporter